MAELWQLTLHEASRGLQDKRFTSVELTQACLERIEQVEDRVKSFVTLVADLALEQAEAADQRRAQGEAGPLTGIPVQVKDLMCTKGIRTTCSSKMLENYVPVYNATVVDKIMGQGAVLLGKGNMDEFAMGSSCENSAFFPTHNPWDLARVPGGSSGGAAASVAAEECIFSLGSDTGGSIRQPAALCGVVGLKPTYGLVSRYGLIAFASSLDQIGPVGKDVTDCALALNAIAGYDPRDSTSLPQGAKNYSSGLTGDLQGVRLGVPEEYFVEGTRPGVREAVNTAIAQLESLGASIQPVSLPNTRHALACYYIIAPSECSANLARYDGVKYGFSFQDTEDMWEAMEKTRQQGFGPEVKRRVMLGAYALSSGYYDAYYLKA
ncbi:MAG: Asp-tRNA(Asn)/Glu-tRNA(Gln) amidotransferase subunit GatA, partial [Dehalococcoidia bacterium]